MKWTNGHDVLLLREILAVEPYTFKPKIKERGNAWTLIANTLNTLKDPMFNVNQRSVRDRYKVLETRFNEKEREEAKASGISPEESEIDQAMQEIIEKMNEAEQSYHKISEEKKDKEEKDKKSADEMRRRSLETFAETRKRKELNDSNEDKPKKAKRSRSTGAETMAYLKKNADEMKDMKERKLELLAQQQQQQSTQQQNSASNQQAMLLLMQQQFEHQKQQQQQALLQQQQMQLQHQQQAQMQQQMLQAFLASMQKLFEQNFTKE